MAPPTPVFDQPVYRGEGRRQRGQPGAQAQQRNRGIQRHRVQGWDMEKPLGLVQVSGGREQGEQCGRQDERAGETMQPRAGPVEQERQANRHEADRGRERHPGDRRKRQDLSLEENEVDAGGRAGRGHQDCPAEQNSQRAQRLADSPPVLILPDRQSQRHRRRQQSDRGHRIHGNGAGKYLAQPGAPGHPSDQRRQRHRGARDGRHGGNESKSDADRSKVSGCPVVYTTTLEARPHKITRPETEVSGPRIPGQNSDVQVAHVLRVLLDEQPARLDFVSHQLARRASTPPPHLPASPGGWSASRDPSSCSRAARDSSRPGPCSAGC